MTTKRVGKPRKCNCVDWEVNISKMTTGFLMQSLCGFEGYTGKQFVYCPWCGEKLKQLNKKESQNAKTTI